MKNIEGKSNKSKLNFYTIQVSRMEQEVKLPYYNNKPIAKSCIQLKLQCFIKLKEKYEILALKEKLEKKLPKKGIKKGVNKI